MWNDAAIAADEDEDPKFTETMSAEGIGAGLQTEFEFRNHYHDIQVWVWDARGKPIFNLSITHHHDRRRSVEWGAATELHTLAIEMQMCFAAKLLGRAQVLMREGLQRTSIIADAA